MKQEIIYAEQYALIVSDEEIKQGDWCVDKHDVVYKQETDKIFPKFSGAKKVIAHRPLTDAPILEGVPLLPEFAREDDVEKIADVLKAGSTYRDYEHLVKRGIIIGYNKAKETYRFSEDDLRKALLIKHDGLSVDYVIQSLQQAKRPKYFECEMEQLPSNESFGLDYGSFNLKPKTITNSQGQTELVGSYIY
jgi:hypothetical protein